MINGLIAKEFKYSALNFIDKIKREKDLKNYMTVPCKVFVYGTLKKGFGNHRVLGASKFISKAITVDHFSFTIYGSFPYMGKLNPFVQVQGEIYEVTDLKDLKNLDMLEGFRPGSAYNHYTRERIYVKTESGATEEVWTYLSEAGNGRKKIESGIFESPIRRPFL